LSRFSPIGRYAAAIISIAATLMLPAFHYTPCRLRAMPSPMPYADTPFCRYAAAFRLFADGAVIIRRRATIAAAAAITPTLLPFFACHAVYFSP